MQNYIIAIDGPAGAGKSTVAKKLASMIGFTYIDTGAMYRALTLKVLANNIPLDNIEEIIRISHATDIDFVNSSIFLDGKNVDIEIRSDIVNQSVSSVAKIAEVRKKMVEIQRRIASGKNIIMDGRDIGTVIFPYAFVKFFITATAEERAMRRFLEQKDRNNTLEEIKEQIIERDFVDSTRAESPLKMAYDGVLVDTTGKSIEEVITWLIDYIKSIGGIIDVI